LAAGEHRGGWHRVRAARRHLGLPTEPVQALERSQAYANPVAAMPSLHGAFAVLAVVFFLPRTRHRFWPLLLAYPLLMALTLVSTGEHYVIDVVAGWITVGAVYFVVGWLETAWSRRILSGGAQ
jgi:membrane-associated phospholipid phosphatase